MVAIASAPVQPIPVAKIEESPLNPRRHFRKLAELGASLKLGQIEAIVVRPHPSKPDHYELANGARRLRAAREAGLPTLEAKVRELSDAEMFDIILGSGADGGVDPLTPLEEAQGYADWMAKLGLSLDEVAGRCGRSRAYVHQRLALLQLPAEARSALESGELSERTAWLIARVPSEKARESTAHAVMHSDQHGGIMPSRAADAFIRATVCRSLQGAPFDPEDSSLVPHAGKCSACPHRAGNDPETYGDMLKNPHTCMLPSCFEQKQAARRAQLITREAGDGREALSEEENAAAFPAGKIGLAWDSTWVEFTKPIPADLLKREVQKAPTWRSLIGDDVVKVRVGFDQQDRAVELVKLSEALVAVPVEEQAIFNDEVRRKKMREVDAPAAPASDKPAEDASQREIEAKAERERKKFERAQQKKAKETRAWLEQLREQLAAGKPPAWHGIVFWTLLFELAMEWLTDDDVRFAAECIAGVPKEDECTREALGKHVDGLPLPEMAALTIELLLIPRVRLEGVQCDVVKAWHEAFLLAPAAAKAADSETETFHAATATADEIAERNRATQLRLDVEEAFERQGLKTAGTRDRIVKTVCGQMGAKKFADVSTVAQCEALLKFLNRKPEPKPVATETDAEK
jgi:ParB/RepB/Spo0J family partition protein